MQMRHSKSTNTGQFSSTLIARLSVLFFVLALCGWCQISRADLIAYWNFNEGTGTNVFDSSSNAAPQHGFFAVAPETPTWVAGRFGNAVNFRWQNQTNFSNTTLPGQRVIVPYHTNLTMNGPITISYWYRPDAPFPAGTFPGIMRIGAQGATAPYGWGFFRQNNMVYKRGNNQPGIFGNMNLNQWNHLAFRFDGNLTGNNTIAFLNGVQVAFAAANGWSNVAATTVFEMGRMDAFDQATLDELALWGNEAVAPGKIRSLYTVPTSLGLDYDLVDLRAIWAAFDGPAGSTAVVKGRTWTRVASVPGSTTDGDAYLSGTAMYIVLGNGAGVSSPTTFLTGTFSPGGIGIVGTVAPTNTLGVTNASLIFDLNTNTTTGAGVNDLLDIAGDVAFVNTTLSVDPLGVLPGGTYRLINYSGTKTGSLILSNTTRYSLTLNEATAGQISLTVTGSSAGLRWNSTNNAAWDRTTANWFNLSGANTNNEFFFQGDSVLFDETLTNSPAGVTVATPVFPNAVTVNSSNRNYSITGAGQIGGVAGGLTKSGASILTLSTPNTFVGTTRVNEGMLRIGNATALGATNGGTVIANGATLDLNATSPGFEPITVGGAGLNSTGAVINSSGTGLVNNGLRGRVTLTGDTTFGGVGRWDVIGGTLVGGGFKLTKTGPPEIALSDLGETALGDIDVLQGILTILGTTKVGDPAKTITVNTNAILAFWALGNNVLNKPVVLNSGILRNATSGGTDIATNLGATTLNGDIRFEANPSSMALLGPVGGAGNLLKVNAGTLYLGGTNTYTGNSTISGGRLTLLANGSIRNSPRIDVQTGTSFDVSAVTGGFAVSSNQTLSGSGSVVGSLAVPAGASVLPGAENVTATLTVSNGNLTLSGGTVTYDLNASTNEGAGINDLIAVAGNLTLNGTSTINVNPLGLLTVGNTYTLINYSGTLTGTAANLAVTSNSRYSFTVGTATAGKITLTVSGGAAADLLWFGGAPGAANVWDLKTTPNWSDSVGASSTFFGGDKAVFDDFAMTNIVNLVGALTPASIRAENGTSDYLFQGSGSFSGGASLTKLFGGKLTIANSGVNNNVGPTDIQGGTVQVGAGGTAGNLGSGAISITNGAALILNRSDALTVANAISGAGALIKSNANQLTLPAANPNFSGGITVAGGTIRPGVSNALGNTTGGTVIASGATLDVNAVNLADEQVTAGGAGVGGTGAIINNGAGQNNALRFVTLSGNTTVGGSGRWDIRANPTASLSTGSNSYSLTKVGANQISIVDAVVDPALGDINVNAGIFSVEAGAGAGDPTKTLTLASNATLQFFNRTVVWNKNHLLFGGSTVLNNSGDNTMDGAMTLSNGAVNFNVGGAALTVRGPIGGNGALTKVTGAGSLWLGGDNTYAGPTTITTGPMYLGLGTNSGSVRGSIVNNVSLGIFRSDAYTFTNPMTGSGSINIRSPNGITMASSPLTLGAMVVGTTNAGKLILQPGFVGTFGNYFLGDSPNVPGEVVQLGGDVTVTAQVRIGHWPNNLSTYTMGGGTFTITSVPTGVVNLAGQPEQPA
jgi:autotransporter-associated beta strand protein